MPDCETDKSCLHCGALRLVLTNRITHSACASLWSSTVAWTWALIFHTNRHGKICPFQIVKLKKVSLSFCWEAVYSCFEMVSTLKSPMGMAASPHASVWNWQILPSLWCFYWPSTLMAWRVLAVSVHKAWKSHHHLVERSSDYSCFEHGYCPSSLMGMATPAHASLWNWQILSSLWRNRNYICFEHGYCPSSLLGMANPAHARLWKWQNLAFMTEKLWPAESQYWADYSRLSRQARMSGAIFTMQQK